MEKWKYLSIIQKFCKNKKLKNPKLFLSVGCLLSDNMVEIKLSQSNPSFLIYLNGLWVGLGLGFGFGLHFLFVVVFVVKCASSAIAFWKEISSSTNIKLYVDSLWEGNGEDGKKKKEIFSFFLFIFLIFFYFKIFFFFFFLN